MDFDKDIEIILDFARRNYQLYIISFLCLKMWELGIIDEASARDYLNKALEHAEELRVGFENFKES